MQARRGGIYVSMHQYTCHAPSPPPQPRLTPPCRKLPPKPSRSRSCKQASTMCGNAPHASCADSKSSPQAQKLSASRPHACTREERIHYRHGRRRCRHGRSTPVCHRSHPTATLSDAAHDTRSLPCVARQGQALCEALCGLADSRPQRPYAAMRGARRGGALCGLARGGPRHVKALRAVRVAQAAQLARRARRDDGALCIRGRVTPLRIRLLPQVSNAKLVPHNQR
jgi:hypothetical protein